jgi:hypothetical protein
MEFVMVLEMISIAGAEESGVGVLTLLTAVKNDPMVKNELAVMYFVKARDALTL